MWQALNPQETEQALQARADFPEPVRLKPSTWGQIAELVQAPYQGFAQGVNQTLRVGARLVDSIPGGASEAIRQRNKEISGEIDVRLRENVKAWAPDPLTSTTASQFIQEGTRFLTKVGGYGLAGGPVGAAVGTAVDEGATGYLEMRDKGVDAKTAAQVGGVRAVASGVSVALPVVGKTLTQTAGLVLLGGPGTFVAEQAATREILEAAEYPELAAQYDPLDPMGLALSVAVPGVIGAAAHAVRMRKPAAAALADSPEHLDAAHVAYRDEQARAGAMAEPGDFAAVNRHLDQVGEAVRALEDDAAVHAIYVEPARAEAIRAEVARRLEANRDEVEVALREATTDAPADAPGRLRGDRMPQPDRLDMPVPRASDVVAEMGRQANAPPELVRMVATAAEAVQRLGEIADRAAEAQPARSPLREAEAVAARRPDLPVRLDESDKPTRARDVVELVRQDVARDRRDSRAYTAAVECFLRSGE